MAISKEKSVYFAGGKKLELTTNDNTNGLHLQKNQDGSWQIHLALTIPAAEAARVVRTFTDFKTPDGHQVTPEQLEELFPNQIYFVAFGADQQPIAIAVDSAKMSVTQDKDDDEGDGSGEVVITITPSGGVGKTQNVFTGS